MSKRINKQKKRRPLPAKKARRHNSEVELGVPVEVAIIKAKPEFYDGGSSTCPIEIKPLPS